MNDSENVLKDFVSSKSHFITLLEGEEFVGKFLSAQKIPDPFNGGKTQTIRYCFLVNGEKKLIDRSSRKLAEQMSYIKEGEIVKIKRTGEKSKTKYSVKKID